VSLRVSERNVSPPIKLILPELINIWKFMPYFSIAKSYSKHRARSKLNSDNGTGMSNEERRPLNLYRMKHIITTLRKDMS
jgi:hypothetical protein